MKESIVAPDTANAAADSGRKQPPVAKQKWETPKLEDVSEQVMAQPYIRFT